MCVQVENVTEKSGSNLNNMMLNMTCWTKHASFLSVGTLALQPWFKGITS